MKSKVFNRLIPGAFAAISLLFVSPESQGSLQSVKISSQDNLENARWVFDTKQAPKGKASARALASMKQARLERDFKTCAAGAGKARSLAKDLKPWISVLELECATQNAILIKEGSGLATALATAEASKDWIASGPHANALRQRLIEARFALLDLDIKKNRTRAAAGVEKLESLQPYMDNNEKARLWRLAGEVSFMQQRLDEAREYIQRSLALADAADLRSKLASIEESLTGRSKLSETIVKPTPAPASADLEASNEEIEIVNRMTLALKGGDLVPAVEDGMKLIREFPGGTRAKWATDRILDVYLSVADKSDEKFILLKDKIVKLMEKGDADRLAEWARVGYNRGFYEDALRLSRRSLESMSDSARSTKTYGLAAEAALHTDKFDVAKELYQTLITKHAGTPFAREALLRVGLIEYRQKNYQAAMASLERLLVLPGIENFELTARHWLWRSLQKVKEDARAKEQAQILMTKFPFSYYGLRARTEAAGGQFLEWPKEAPANLETKLMLTAREKNALDRAKLLIESGWFDEAQLEIQQMPPAVKPEEKALRAQLLASAFNYPQATKLVNEAWDANQSLRRPPFIAIAFPREFQKTIETQALARKLEPSLVMSLIKQESAYNIRAVSSSNALGLMQMIPPTAREIAQDLKMGELVLPDDLFIPAQNIRMGTYYLAKVLKKVSGHVPLALAGYNAGPHRVDRWVKSRPSLAGLQQLRSSNPDDELWFDEIPWDETSYYVKAILRNLLLYRVLDKSKVEIKNPIWVESGETNQAVMAIDPTHQ